MKDEFDGIGGSYVVDPVTGNRKLVERTRDPVESEITLAATPAEITAALAAPEKETQ